MAEPWSSAAALAVGAFAGALLVGWLARSAIHAGYLALVVVVLCVVALPQGTALLGDGVGLAFLLLAGILGAGGFVLGRQLGRRRRDRP